MMMTSWFKRPVLFFWLFAAVWVLAACASSTTRDHRDPAATASDGGAWQTASDESQERRRAHTRLALASGYYEDGKYTIALDENKKALDIDPSYGDAWNMGGMIYLALGDRGRAYTNFKRAISLNSRDGNAMHNLAWMYCEDGDYEQADAQFEQALNVPGYMEEHRTLMVQGICQARAGDLARAEATLKRSFELDAGNPITSYNLAQLLLDRGDAKQAQFYIRRLNNSELANAQSLLLGIRVENSLGNQQAVRELADQLRRRFPSSDELGSYERGVF